MNEALDLIRVGLCIGIGIVWGVIVGYITINILGKLCDKAILFLKEILNEQKRKKDFGFRS